MKKKIIFTGGGSGGHVTPNLALIDKFLFENWKVFYIGSKYGIENKLIGKKVQYFSIQTGKFRRYFSWKNITDPFKIIFGIIQSLILCYKIKPNIVFSKGGFVSLPVVIAAWLLKIPVIIHESDLTIGLTNKLSFLFATKICVAFHETANLIKKTKVVVTGIPLGKNFLKGKPKIGKKICGFTDGNKIITILGGSLGADKINNIIRTLVPVLTEKFLVVHICGKNKIDREYKLPNYKQFEYLYEDFRHVLAASDIIISRSGASSIYEIIALRKPNILLPLPRTISRGEQIENANFCFYSKFSEIIYDEQLTTNLLLEKINAVEYRSSDYIASMNNFVVAQSTDIIYKLSNYSTSTKK